MRTLQFRQSPDNPSRYDLLDVNGNEIGSIAVTDQQIRLTVVSARLRLEEFTPIELQLNLTLEEPV